MTLPTTVRGVSPAPPFGFRLLASARRFPPPGFRSLASASWLPLVGFRLWVRFARPLPLLVFEAPFSSLAFPRLLEIAWFRPVLVASPVSADLSRACPAPFPPVAWPPPRVSFFTSSAPRVRFRASFWVPSGSLLGPLGSSFLASLPHFSGRPVHPCRLPAIHDLPWVRSDSHFPGSCSSFPSSASGVFSSLREGASIPPLHVMHFLSLPHSFFAMTGFWLSPTLLLRSLLLILFLPSLGPSLLICISRFPLLCDPSSSILLLLFILS